MSTQPSNAGDAPTAAPVSPLAGVRILDMATVLAAPFGATLCGDWGAEVVKLELPDGSDPLRGLSPVQDGFPLFWKVSNRGKKGITLDVRKPAGRALFLQLVAGFDVLVENFRPGTLDRWGLEAATLHAANPRLVILRLTGFGQDGPASARPGFARVFEAMSGFTNLSGEAGGSPLHMNYPIGDVIAGTFAGFAIAAAVARMRGAPDAPGFEIDLAATEALLRLLDPLPVEVERLGTVRGPSGNLANYTAPSSMYRTRDGVRVTMVGSSNPVFARVARAIGRPELATDPRFSTMQARVDNYLALDDLLCAWFGANDYVTVERALDEGEVPFARVQSMADVMRDPHFVARDAVTRIHDPDLGSLPAPCVVPRIVGQTLAAPRSGPAVGEHNAEIYGALGLDAAALTKLKAEGVI